MFFFVVLVWAGEESEEFSTQMSMCLPLNGLAMDQKDINTPHFCIEWLNNLNIYYDMILILQLTRNLI